MADRRKKPPNRWGCKPVEDVCVEHDAPLDCKHGCDHAKEHECAEQATKDQLP
jgi:hypothetical protein